MRLTSSGHGCESVIYVKHEIDTLHLGQAFW